MAPQSPRRADPYTSRTLGIWATDFRVTEAQAAALTEAESRASTVSLKASSSSTAQMSPQILRARR